MRTTITAVCLVVLAASTACCAAARPAPGGAPIASAPTLRAPGEAQVGDRTTCPVSGEEFIVSATSPWIEHEGRMYYFCCADCAHKFEAEPAKYLRGAAAKPVTETQTPEPAPAAP